VSFIGIWSPGLATVMILLGLTIGLLIYLIGKLGSIREADSFIGGEQFSDETRITGTGFYHTISEIKGIRRLYRWAENNLFDIYDQGHKLSLGISRLFRRVHSGVLTIYITWILLGIVIFLIVLVGRL
jgi:hypothetical protein